MPSRRHVALHGIGLRDVYDGVEEVCFAVLAAEILSGSLVPCLCFMIGWSACALWRGGERGEGKMVVRRIGWGEAKGGKYPAYDSIVASEVRFAVFAAEDFVCVEVDVVG